MPEHPSASTPGDDDVLRIVRFGDVHEPVGITRSPVRDALPSDDLAQIAGGHDGLDRVKMLDAIDGLRATGRAIEALQVVRAVCDRPQYALERRSYERGMVETAHQWCLRSQHQARDFVATFADPGDGSVRFVLVTVDAEDQRKAA